MGFFVFIGAIYIAYKIVTEESIGNGIRRITAKSKMAAYRDYDAYEDTLKQMAGMLKMNSINAIDEKVAQLIEVDNGLRKTIASMNQAMLMLKADEMAQSAEEINGLKVVIRKLENADSSSLKGLAESIRNKVEDSFVFLANVAASSKAAIAKGIKAGDMAKMAAQLSGGNGGGRPDLAQSGGKDISNINGVLAQIREKL